MARSEPDPRTPKVSGTATVSGIRHTGPLERPWDGPRHKHSSAKRLTFALVAVAVLAVISGGAYVATRPSASSTGTTAQPPAGRPAPAAPSATATPSVKVSTAPSTDATPASGQRMPLGDLPGWHQTFVDDFSGNALDDRWYAYSGQPAGDPGGWFDPNHVSVGNGMLTIEGSKQKTPNGMLYATGGVSNHNAFSQKYGKFDVRFRMDRGVGIMYALLLWPSSNKWPPEIDIIEDNGSDRTWTTATVHWGAANHTIERRTYHRDFTQWHTASLEWTPGHLRYLLDGEEWGRVDSPNVPAEPMDLALQTQAFNCGGAFEKCPNSTTPPVVNLQIDWVSCYEWTGP